MESSVKPLPCLADPRPRVEVVGKRREIFVGLRTDPYVIFQTDRPAVLRIRLSRLVQARFEGEQVALGQHAFRAGRPIAGYSWSSKPTPCPRPCT